MSVTLSQAPSSRTSRTANRQSQAAAASSQPIPGNVHTDRKTLNVAAANYHSPILKDVAASSFIFFFFRSAPLFAPPLF